MAVRGLASSHPSKPRHFSHYSLSTDPAFHIFPPDDLTHDFTVLSSSSKPKRDVKTGHQSISPARAVSKGNSQAVAGAIRALQDKVRFLERENEAISRDLCEKLLCEKRVWEENARLDLIEYREKEETVRKRVVELEDELHKQRLKEINLEECIKSITAQMENRQENSLFEREKSEKREKALANRVETMEKQMEQKRKEVELIELNLLHVETEKRRLDSENSDLRAEINRLRGEIDRQKHSETNEKSALITKLSENEQISAEFRGKMTAFERENQHLIDLNRAKDAQIQFCREEIENLKRAHAMSESARATMSLENEKARKLILELSFSREKLNREAEKQPKSRTLPGKSPKSASKPTAKHIEKHAKPIESDPVSGQIAAIEREISRLNEMYNQILAKADSMDLGSLRGELNDVAARMESKWRELEDLRRRQSE